jgi:PAS domain S-box-containing protein
MTQLEPTSSQNAHESKPAVNSYLIAVLSTIVAVIVRMELDPVLGDQLPFPTFFIAMMFTAWYGGLGPTLLAIVLGLLAADYFFLPPRGVFGIENMFDLLGWMVFVVVGLTSAFLSNAQRAAQHRAERSAAEAQKHLERLEFETRGRERADKLVQETESRFRLMADTAPVLIWASGTDKMCDYFNRPWLEFRGRTLEQEWGMGWTEGVHPEDVKLCVDTYYNAFDQRQDFTIDYRLLRHDGVYRWIHDNGVPRFAPDGTFIGYIGTGLDITETKRAESASKFLAEASEILSSSLDYETTLTNVAKLATPTLADWCAVDILTEDEEIKRLAVSHVDPDKVKWAYELQRRYPVDPNATAGVPQVLRSGEPQFIPLVTQEMINAATSDEEMLRIIDEIGFRSTMTVPLTARGRTFGTLSLTTTRDSGRLLDESDLAMALELGQRAAMAVDNARLYREAQAQRERLRVTLSSIGDAVMATDAQGNINFMNGVAEAVSGWREADAYGKHLDSVFRIVNEDTRATVESPVGKVLREGVVVGLANHTILLAKDGREVPIDDSGAPIRDDKGAITGVVLVFRDITERKKAEAALRASEQRIQRLIESNVIGIAFTDFTGQILDANDAVLNMIGHTHAEVEAGELNRFVITPPEHHHFTRQAIEEMRRTGSHMPYEKEFIRKDGTRVPVMVGGVYLGGANELSVSYIIDLTERNKAQEAQRENEERLRLAVDAAHIGTWDWDVESNRVSYGGHHDQLYGIEAGTFGGTYEAFINQIHREDRDHMEQRIRAALENDDSYEAEYRVVWPDESVHWIFSRARVYRDASGKATRMLGVVQDITERKQVEQARTALLEREQEARKAAEEANELKLKFLAMISHELRTPLTSIKGFTSTLIAPDVRWEEQQQQEFLMIMDEEADKLTDLVEQLLDVSRLQAGTLRIKTSPQAVLDIVGTAIAQLEATTTNHQLLLDIPNNLPRVMADNHRIAQVLVNLVDNAAKYSPPHTRITVAAHRVDGMVQIDVSDEGEGIRPDDRLSVFEAFRQIDRQTRQRGAGLGLAICKGLIETHGGQIWIQDKPIGTMISFTLPIETNG